MILDLIAATVRQVLAVFDPKTAEMLFVPVFVVVVVAGFVLAAQKLAAPLARGAAAVLSWAIAGLSALVLLAEMAVAGGYRRRAVRPPSALYNLGDSVASAATGLTAGARRFTAMLAGWTAAATLPVLVGLSIGWIVIWNHQYCPAGEPACAGPVSAWFQQVSGKQ